MIWLIANELNETKCTCLYGLRIYRASYIVSSASETSTNKWINNRYSLRAVLPAFCCDRRTERIDNQTKAINKHTILCTFFSLFLVDNNNRVLVHSSSAPTKLHCIFIKFIVLFINCLHRHSHTNTHSKTVSLSSIWILPGSMTVYIYHEHRRLTLCNKFYFLYFLYMRVFLCMHNIVRYTKTFSQRYNLPVCGWLVDCVLCVCVSVHERYTAPKMIFFFFTIFATHKN